MPLAQFGIADQTQDASLATPHDRRTETTITTTTTSEEEKKRWEKMEGKTARRRRRSRKKFLLIGHTMVIRTATTVRCGRKRGRTKFFFFSFFFSDHWFIMRRWEKKPYKYPFIRMCRLLATHCSRRYDKFVIMMCPHMSRHEHQHTNTQSNAGRGSHSHSTASSISSINVTLADRASSDRLRVTDENEEVKQKALTATTKMTNLFLLLSLVCRFVSLFISKQWIRIDVSSNAD